MSATRNARLAVVCILLTAITTCSRRHESQDFLPSAPSTQNALQITNVGAISLPADGVSTVRIEAQISPDANVTRLVRFQTTLGGWLEATATTVAAQRTGGQPIGAQVPGAQQADLPQVVDKEADTAGRVAAFLQSTDTEGTAVVTVSVIAKDAAGNVTDTFATVTRDVTFTQVSGALELRVDPTETFADGISGITLEAEISADSPASWNMVIFETTLGSLDSLGADAEEQPLKVTVPTDGNRIARARLTSSTPGTGSVRATIEEFPEASVSQFVTFAGQNPDAINISTSAGEVPADGTSQISVTATLDASLASREVTFTTSAGIFVTGTISAGMQETKASTDASNQATVQLQSDTTVNPSVLLTASIQLATSTAQSASKTIAFVEVAGGDISAAPQNLNFGDVTVDTNSDLSLNIGNHGAVPLNVTGLTPDPADQGFAVHLPPTLPAAIQPNSSLGITVRFNPTTTGSKNAVLKIASDDPAKPEFSVAMTGVGVDPAPNIEVDKDELDFGSVMMAGETKDMVVTVSNTGTADLEVSDITSNNGVFTVESATSFTVVPGGSQPVTVRFDPDAVQPESGVLTIESDDPQAPETAVELTGTGT